MTNKRTPSMFVRSDKNPKIGPRAIVQYIGETRADCKASCNGCILLDPPAGEPRCYAQTKGMAWTHTNMIKAAGKGKPYEFDNALDNTPGAKLIRLGGIGDPSASNRNELKRIKAGRIPVIGYTHFWNSRGSDLKGICLASCDTWAEADAAVSDGWRAALWIKGYSGEPVIFSPAGNRAVFCVNQQDKAITCQDCLLCIAGPKFETSAPIIVFDYH